MVISPFAAFSFIFAIAVFVLFVALLGDGNPSLSTTDTDVSKFVCVFALSFFIQVIPWYRYAVQLPATFQQYLRSQNHSVTGSVY